MTFDEIEIKGLNWTHAKREYQAEVRRLYLKYCDKVLKSNRNDEVPWGGNQRLHLRDLFTKEKRLTEGV